MKKILLIEDNINNQHLIMRFLIKDGHQITPCHSASEAYEFIQQKEFNLVITDYALPDENGIQIAEKLRSDLKTQSIPIILLSAGAFDTEEKIYHESLTNRHLSKPIDFNLLRKTVSDLLKNN